MLVIKKVDETDAGTHCQIKGFARDMSACSYCGAAFTKTCHACWADCDRADMVQMVRQA